MKTTVTVQRLRQVGLWRVCGSFWCRIFLVLACSHGLLPLVNAMAQVTPSQLPPIFDPTGRSGLPRPLEEEEPRAPVPSPLVLL